MKIFHVLALGTIAFSYDAFARQVPIPEPTLEVEVRENSTRMRSIELERIKRESAKLRPRESSKEREINFAEIKEDFENIQKLQDGIIKSYTSEKKINYSKISQSAADMRNKALRLNTNLFGTKSDEANASEDSNNVEKTNVKNLIIELDNAIGSFISSPIFQNTKVVDRKASEIAQSNLKKILNLSCILSGEADKMK
jgi:hypothetical protein